MKKPRFLNVLYVFILFASLAISNAALVGYWNFNEGSGTAVADATGNAAPGLLAPLGAGSTPIWVTGHTGTDKALLFDQGSATIGDNTALHITNQFTLSFWVKAETSSNYGHVFVAGSASNGTSRDWLWQTRSSSDANPYFWSDTNTSSRQTLNSGSFAVSITTWHLETLVYDKNLTSNRMKLYEDGVLKTQYNPNFSISSWGNLQLGGAGNVFGSGFEGILDDMAIFNEALSSTEVMNIYTGTNSQINAIIPEPASFMLLGLGGLSLALLRKRS